MQFLREQPPLPLYFLIIAAQTIDARDAEWSPGRSRASRSSYRGRRKSLPDIRSVKILCLGMPCRCRDRCWRSAFWSVLDTRA